MKVVSLFSGAGGLDYGFINQGMKLFGLMIILMML